MAALSQVVDWYKNATLCNKEMDIEVEAIALSRLSRVYHKANMFECTSSAIKILSIHSIRLGFLMTNAHK